MSANGKEKTRNSEFCHYLTNAAARDIRILVHSVVFVDHNRLYSDGEFGRRNARTTQEKGRRKYIQLCVRVCAI